MRRRWLSLFSFLMAQEADAKGRAACAARTEVACASRRNARCLPRLRAPRPRTGSPARCCRRRVRACRCQRRRDRATNAPKLRAATSPTPRPRSPCPPSPRAPGRAWAAWSPARHTADRRARCAFAAPARAACGELAVERQARQVGADHGDLRNVGCAGASARWRAGARQRQAGRASGNPVRGVKALTDLREHQVAAAGRSA